jgi:hypothetical protein
MKFLVDFKQDATLADIQAYLQANNCNVVKQYQNYEEVYLVDTDIEPPVTDIVETAIKNESNPINLMGVSFDLGTDFQYGQFSNTDSKDWWKVASIMTPDFSTDVETYPILGNNVTIYIMDSGIDLTHPEFADAKIQTMHSFTSDFTDTTGHGTSLASVIAGKTCGMTSASVKVVKVFDNSVETLQSDLLDAFDAIISDFVANGKTASVVNMSWGIAKNTFIESKIAKLIEAGVYAVAAAGNSGVEIGDVTPAGMDMVTTIGSYSQDFMPSDFSNYSSATSLTTGATNGGQLDGWAPGEDIYVALVGGGYGLVSGTSIAAAIHTAATAYNLATAVTSDGQIAIKSISEDTFVQTFVGTVGFYRRNLIHLDDPKYSSSVNLVTTFKTKPYDVGVGALAELKVKSGQEWGFDLFNRLTVSSATCDGLPEGMTFDNGLLLGKIDITDGSTWKYFDINFTLSLREGGEVPYQVRMWVVADTLDESDPTVDPQLKITPYATGGTCNVTTCATNGCTACHNCGSAKQMDCYCTGVACM